MMLYFNNIVLKKKLQHKDPISTFYNALLLVELKKTIIKTCWVDLGKLANVIHMGITKNLILLKLRIFYKHLGVSARIKVH